MKKYYNKDIGVVMNFYKLERWLYLHGYHSGANIIFRVIYLLFNCYIPPTCEIGQGSKFPHGIGIVIHHTAKIGKNSIIFQNVTIGGGDGICIGDNCIIGTGAVICGSNLSIGNNVNIGALTFVNYNIPDNSTVVGQKGHIVRNF